MDRFSILGIKGLGVGVYRMFALFDASPHPQPLPTVCCHMV